MARKKEPETQATTSSMKGFYLVLGAVAVIGLGAVGFSLAQGGAFSGAATEPVDMEGVDARRLVELSESSRITMGSDDAPVLVYEFSDYSCPWCGVFHSQIKPMLKLGYIDPGKVQLIFYDFPLISIHDNSFLAHRAARCAADQGRYWEYHSVLFGRQGEWVEANNAPSRFIDYAQASGLDVAGFESCLESDRHAEVVTANYHLAQQLGVTGTPTFFVGRRGGQPKRVMSLRSWDQLREIIDNELGQ